MRKTLFLFLVVMIVFPSTALAVDFNEYVALKERALELYEAVGGENVTLEMRQEAVEADLALIAWLESFFATEEFGALPETQQADAYSDRYRWEYNLSRQLLILDRCEEARDRIRTLLDSAISDDELRPRLTTVYEEALACLTRSRTATLQVECTPEDANVLVDGAYVGAASTSFEVELGEHEVTIRAEGYTDANLTFIADNEGDEITLGPVALVALPEEVSEPGKPPLWHEWTLWGVGAAGIGAGIGTFVAASQRQSDLDDINDPYSGRSVADPEGEQDQIDMLKLVAIISGGIGIAAAVTGTVLYFIRDVEGNRGEEAVSWGATWAGDGAEAWVRVRF